LSDTRCRLYLITPSSLADLAAFAQELEKALGASDVACLQLRLKDASDEDVLNAAKTLKPICEAFDVALIINDRPDLALTADADGVHVGQDDTSYADARKLLGPDRIIGVTCHDSRHLAMEAADAGADYVAFGAFFDTTTKEAKTRADVENLRWWADVMTTPCVAIGGITVDNAEALVIAGAEFLAVSGGVWNHSENPAAAVAAFNELFERLAMA